MVQYKMVIKMKYVKNIVNRVELAEKRAAVFYAKTDGKLYKWLKNLYVLFLSITSLMGFFYCISRYIKISEIQKLNLEIANYSNITAVKQSILTVLFCSLAWIISAVIIKWEQEIISAIILISSGSVAVSTLITASKNTAEFNTGINVAFWWRHLCLWQFLYFLLFGCYL